MTWHSVAARAAVLFACLMLGLAHAAAQDASAREDELPGNKVVKARFALENTAIAPDGTTHLAVVFDIAPGWHLYWRNAGDGGLPPRVTFTPIPGVTFAEPQWPAPLREVARGGLINYVYERQLVMIFPIVTATASAGAPLEISARIDWLVCKDRCIPGRAQLSSSWPVAAGAPPSADADVFIQARKRHPLPASVESNSCAVAWRDFDLLLRVDGASRLAFFPYENDAGVYPDNILSGGESASDSLRLHYPGDVAKLKQVAGLLVVTRDGIESYLEIDTPPPAGNDPAGPAK